MKANYKSLAAVILVCGAAACSQPAPEFLTTTVNSSDVVMDMPGGMTMGNGVDNHVGIDTVKRDGDRLIVEEVKLAKDGFLVVHPYRNGKPAGREYVGAKFYSAGSHKDADVMIDEAVSSGDQFLVMLHYDMNMDGIFDFGDGYTVPDIPVFEGTQMISLPIIAP